jgi:hypothetical protein
MASPSLPIPSPLNSSSGCPDSFALARFDQAALLWQMELSAQTNKTAPSLSTVSLLAWTWCAELSDAERGLLSRMARDQAIECVLRGHAMGARVEHDAHGRLMRRMGRAAALTNTVCRSTSMSPPWSGQPEWIERAETMPLPTQGAAFAARAEALARKAAPWSLAGAGVLAGAQGSGLSSLAGLAAFGGLCLLLASNSFENHAKAPHKQALLSTLEGVYSDLATTDFFKSARTQPNFLGSNPLASCTACIKSEEDKHLEHSASAARPAYQRCAAQARSLSLDMFLSAIPSLDQPGELWPTAAVHAAREAIALSLTTQPLNSNPELDGPRARKNSPRI